MPDSMYCKLLLLQHTHPRRHVTRIAPMPCSAYQTHRSLRIKLDVTHRTVALQVLQFTALRTA